VLGTFPRAAGALRVLVVVGRTMGAPVGVASSCAEGGGGEGGELPCPPPTAHHVIVCCILDPLDIDTKQATIVCQGGGCQELGLTDGAIFERLYKKNLA